MAKKKERSSVLVLLFIIIALGAGFAIGTQQKSPAVFYGAEEGSYGEYIASKTGFVPANVTISGTRVAIEAGCREISFDVTEDQAFSIDRAISGQTGPRPLTHDIMKDMMEDFEINLLQVRIERFGEDPANFGVYVNYDICIGCMLCAKDCPWDTIRMVPTA